MPELRPLAAELRRAFQTSGRRATRGLNRQDKRNPLRRPKGAQQRMVLLTVVEDRMSQFKLDNAFVQALPDELLPLHDQWMQHYAATHAPDAPRW